MKVEAEGFPLTAAISPRVAYVDHTGSTNADLVVASADAAEYPHLSMLITFDQRRGRGRLDRSWEAPAGASVAASVVLRVGELPVHARGWIPLAAGVAMTEAVRRQLPQQDVRAKWPNDVLVAGRKICGILAEATLTYDTVVVGAGVNTAMAEGELPVPTATSFAVLGVTADVDQLLRDYVQRLDTLVRALTAADGDADASGLREAATAASGTVGSEVRVMLPDGTDLLGTATSIDVDGRLIVATGASSTAVSAGDVVHVRPI